MRLNDDLRKCVAFLGYADPDDPNHGISVVGTGFFLLYERTTYLVTVRHVARDLQDIGWVVRLNLLDGGCRNVAAEGIKWTNHPDPTVDLSITPFGMPAGTMRLFDHLSIGGETILTDPLIDLHTVNVGDFCFTIGLFHLLKGKKRNLPVVHSGTIALMPGDERVPVSDWDDERKTKHVEAFLIESQSMPGLSGSPVLVQPSIRMPEMNLEHPDGSKDTGTGILARGEVYLLGVFQAAWHAKPSEIVAVEHGKQVVVPVGMGVVVPAQKIFEVIQLPELKGPRDERNRQRDAAAAASPTSIQREDVPAVPERPAIEGDEQHKERFTGLLDAAVGKPKQGG